MAQKQLMIERKLRNVIEEDYHQSLTIENAFLYLNKKEAISRLPLRPKARNIYLFFNPSRPADWRADGHR